MKVIDLLNKIANGEEVPNFWWSGCIHKVEKDINGKYNIFDTYYKKYKNIYLEDLNEEVEIIEEPKKIEKIEIYENEDGRYFLNNRDNKIYIRCDETYFMVDKFNELIDEINNLKEK